MLITHGPPYGILDRVASGEQVGCIDLFNAMKRVQPKLHVFGHIHEGYGKIGKEGMIYINPTICNEKYAPSNSCVVYDL